MLIYGAEIVARPGKAGPMAAQVAALRDAVAGATGQEWRSWAVIAGRPYGTFLVSTQFEGMAELIAGQQAAAASPAFQAVAGGYADAASGPATTTTAQILATTGEPGPPPPFISVTQAQIVGGRVADALAWSGRVIEHVKSVSGVDTMLITSAAGPMFQVGFIAGVDTAEAIDQANAALAADTAYLEMMDEAGGLFVSGASERMYAMQMP